MSILDTFYIVFKNMGAKELNKAQGDLKKGSDFVSGSFKKTNKEIQESDKGFSLLTDSASKLKKELFSLGFSAFSAYSIVHQLGNALDFTTNLDKTSRSLSVNIQDLDAWESAVMRNGGTAEGFKASLQALTENLNVTGDTALRILPQFADAFKKLGPITAMRWGKSLGMDESLILTLMQGRDAVDQLIQKEKQLGTVTQEDALSAREFNQSWSDFSHVIRIAFTQIESGALPTLTKLINLATRWVVQFSNIQGDLGLINFSKSLMTTFYLLFKYFEQKLPSFGKLFEDEFSKIENTFSKGFGSFEHKLSVEFPFLKKLGIDTDNSDNKSNKNSSNANSILNSPKLMLQNNNSGLPDDIKSALSLSQKTMNDLNSNPLLSQTNSGITNSFANNYFDKKFGDKSLQVNTGPINIQTQATDSKGIAEAFNRNLQDQLRQVNNYFDDGIQI